MCLSQVSVGQVAVQPIWAPVPTIGRPPKPNPPEENRSLSPYLKLRTHRCASYTVEVVQDE